MKKITQDILQIYEVHQEQKGSFNRYLGGGFRYFLFSPLLGEMDPI